MLWQIRNKRIEVSEDGTFWEDFCENFYIKSVTKNLVTGEETVEIVIEAKFGKTKFAISREKLDYKIISQMLKYGLTCRDNKDNAQIVLHILFETEDTAPCRYHHNILGFTQDNAGKDVFLLHKAVSGHKKSTYINKSKTAPRGTYIAWKKAVMDLILVRPPLQIALAIGASAPVAHILLKKGIITEVPLISLIGQSTTGKTTALRMMSSLWFSPEMISDFNCTQNAFFQRLSQTKGLPILIDEASAVPEWDFTKAIYNMPTGKSKLKCSSNGQLIEPVEFSGTIVITGENSLLAQTNNNDGLYGRMLELNLSWTKDKEHAEAINHYFGNNYGTAGVHLMQWILKNEFCIADMYKKHNAELSEQTVECIKSDVLRRLLNPVALIMTSAEILNLSMGLSMDLNAIANLLICFLAKKDSAYANPLEDWYSKVQSFVLQNISKFKDEDSHIVPSVIWGEKGFHDNKHVYWIEKNIFEKFVAEKLNVELKKLKYSFAKEGWIVRTKSRHYIFKRKFGNAELSCYGLVLSKNPLPKTKPKRKIGKKSDLLAKSQINNLLK